MMAKYISQLFRLTPLAILACCTANVDTHTLGEYADEDAITSSAVEVIDEIWFGGDLIPLEQGRRQPDFLRRPITFIQASPLPYSELLKRISVEIGTPLYVTKDATDYLSDIATAMSLTGTKAEPSFHITHSGSISGLLDVVTADANLSWKWDDGQVIIFRHETKTFTVDLSPEYLELVPHMRNSGFGSGAQFNIANHNMNATSPWESMALTIARMVSSSGRFSVFEQLGTVQVTDTPAVLAQVEDYIQSINKIGSVQISIKAEVYQVKFDSKLYQRAYQHNQSNRPSSSASQRPEEIALKVIANEAGSDYSPGELLSALANVGELSMITSASVRTISGRPVPVNALNEQLYIADVNTPPAVLTSGMSLKLDPRLLSDGSVMLDVEMDLSEINDVNNTRRPEGLVQLPSRTTRNFKQNASIRSGRTMVISGLDVPGAGGRFGKEHTMTLVMITPEVITR